MPTHTADRGLRDRLAPAMRWHWPLMIFAVVMAGTAVVATVGLFVDDRVLVGAPIWAKPFKFAVSFFFYSVAWAWMIAQLSRFRRTAWWAGTIVTFLSVVEMAIIVGQTVRGHRSHFNEATEFDATLWRLMGMTIVGLWIATLVVSAILFANRNGDRPNTWAIRLGAILALIGMGLAFLMVLPTEQQIATDADLVGAHGVGVTDGGPGIPLLNWSTTGGDLRIPHFVGMHALQFMPLLALLLVALAGRTGRRFTALRVESVRLRLIVIAASAYTGLLALVTWQALRGQSIVRPDLWTGASFAVIVVGTALAVRAAFAHGRRVTAAADVAAVVPPSPRPESEPTEPSAPTAGVGS